MRGRFRGERHRTSSESFCITRSRSSGRPSSSIAAVRKFAIRTRRPLVSGLLHGVVYLVINLIVLTVGSRINKVLALMFCIGLTIFLPMRRSTAVS
jgi:hypothetical protein